MIRLYPAFPSHTVKPPMTEEMVFPQAYAAVVPQSSLVVHTLRIFIIDVGGYTTDVLLLQNGKPDL